MLPTAYIAHQVRGRIRLQIREKRKDIAYFEALRSNLDSLDDIDEVRVNSTTGSIVLLHSLQGNDLVVDRLLRLELFEITACEPPATPAFVPLRAGLSSIEQTLRSGSAGGVDFRTLAYIGAIGLSLHQITRGNILGPALPMLWDAFRLIDHIGSTTNNSRTEPTDT